MLIICQIQGESTSSALEIEYLQAHKISRGRTYSLSGGKKDFLREKRDETLGNPSEFGAHEG
jgi:hypothetical protein